MFTSQEYIDRKSDNKEQVLANLANFAYDPINYEHFRKLNVLDLFLDSITEENEKMVEFGIGGICNCCLDKQNKQFIIENGGIPLIINCLSSSTEETVLSALTSLMFLMTPATTKEILCPAVVDCLQEFADSSNKRLSNLAKVFLKDYHKPSY
ncbi:armadillo repeat-containing protein 7 isoform X2 [Nematostella vectensis]|uniref:armadillo repeat-containing protein 7 isoform X2 n=1 Tax=Nematostella vectensis TaxID=45351 RepID=UPI002076E1A7|nr:armadillo repeat-containing protein 7 isoform X2 [Nematostella vectensis]